MEINKPDVLADVTSAFKRYETALVTNDVETLMELFWASSHTVRYGVAELLYGIDEIEAFRKGRASSGLERTIERTVLTTFGDDFATTAIHYVRASDAGKIGRQMQSWVRLPEGWRVVAAHVSTMDAG